MRPAVSNGDRAWLGLAVYVVAYDWLAWRRGWDTLSQSFARSLTDWRKPLILAAWAYLTAHLTRVLPERYDPLRRWG